MTSRKTSLSNLDRNPARALGAFGLLAAALAACEAAPDDAPADPGSGGSATAGGAAGTTGIAGRGGAPTAGNAGKGAGSAGRAPTAGTAGVGNAGTGTGGDGMGGTRNMGGTPSTGGDGASAGSDGGGIAGTGSGGSGTGGTGDPPLGPGLTDVESMTPATCTVATDVTTAEKIPMVGVATFTTDLADADRAVIQFGKTAEYTLEAPVDWPATAHKTLILGMPANTDVHYRVVVMAGDSACVGPDATFQTGPGVSGAPADFTPTKGPSSVLPAPGFILAESTNFAFIINKQGEVVWAYRFPIMLTRALMSWDGKYMIARELGPFNAGSGGTFYRVAMDGTGELKLTLSGGTHHDFTVTPTGIAYPAKQAAGACDSLYTADYDGSNSKQVVDLAVVFDKFAIGPGAPAMETCHVNAIHYYADTDSFSFSDREKDAIAFVSSSGEVLGSVGAAPVGETPNHAKAEGADSTMDSTWRVQHGHDQYAPNKLVLWSNGSFQNGMSKILHYTINGATATLDWEYAGTGNSPTLSDAQHLPNGNFLATCSQSGAVHEIDPEQKLIQSFANLSKAYTNHRTTLYGRPSGR